MQKTSQAFDQIIKKCRDLFEKKSIDYGTSWRILRMPSLTDQIMIKAHRIRSIQEKRMQKIAEGEQEEFVAIINYAIMGLIQLELGYAKEPDLTTQEALKWYDKMVLTCKTLMENKNHDYGEAWRDMRVSSLTDMILQKIHRVKSIEDNEGATLVSEGIAANYQDMLNYSVFALIHLNDKE